MGAKIFDLTDVIAKRNARALEPFTGQDMGQDLGEYAISFFTKKAYGSATFNWEGMVIMYHTANLDVSGYFHADGRMTGGNLCVNFTDKDHYETAYLRLEGVDELDPVWSDLSALFGVNILRELKKEAGL